MSNDARSPGNGVLPEDFTRLATSVRQLLDQLAGYQARAQMAEKKSAELEKTLRDMSSGELDPMQLQDGYQKLRAENEELRRRMTEAQARIRRLVNRFDFLREEL